MTSRVLVVDDDLHVAKLLTTILTGRGYEVRTASDAESAMSSVLALCPAVILIDLEMPSMDRLERCQWVRATSNVPIVVAFASNNRRSEVTALDAGADDYV